MSIVSRPRVVAALMRRPRYGLSDLWMSCRRATRRAVGKAERAYPILLLVAIFGAVLVATIALRFAIWLVALGFRLVFGT
jgi:hypothetical protein